MKLDEFTTDYYQFVTKMIDDKGIFPWPLHAVDADDHLFVGMLLDLPPEECYSRFWSLVTGCDASMREPRAVILGMDRSTRPDQGTEFADVFTCLCYYHDPKNNWGRSLKVGVINYQIDPRIVRPWDWNNEFWTRMMIKEANYFRPPFRLRIEKGSHREELSKY